MFTQKTCPLSKVSTLILILLVSACDSGNSEKLLDTIQQERESQEKLEAEAAAKLRKRYPVIDSGFEVRREGKIFWVDDLTILFEGLDYKDMLDKKGREILVPANALMIWHLGTNQVERYKSQEITGACYADGYVRYLLWDSEGKSHEYIGKIGEEMPSNKMARLA